MSSIEIVVKLVAISLISCIFCSGCTLNSVQSKSEGNADSSIFISPYNGTSCIRNLYDNRTGRVFAINKEGKQLFEIHWYDNGPDYIEEGLFRMKNNDKIGFADTSGTIVIEPQYDFALPFKNGKAVVCNGCKKGSGFTQQGGKCGVIDKKGNIVVPLIYSSIDVDTSGNYVLPK